MLFIHKGLHLGLMWSVVCSRGTGLTRGREAVFLVCSGFNSGIEISTGNARICTTSSSVRMKFSRCLDQQSRNNAQREAGGQPGESEL